MAKTQKTIWWVVGIVIVAGLCLVGIARNHGGSGTIKIGAILPLSGDYAAYGEASENAALMAIDDMDMTSTVQFIIEDDNGCTPAGGVTAAQKLLNIDNVNAIYGPMCSSEALSIRSLTEPKKIPMIIAAATSKTLTGAGQYIFRTISSDSVRSYAAADYVYSKGFRKGAFLFDNNQDALIQEKNDAEEEFTKDGGQIVDEDSFGTNDSDFKTQLVKVKSSGADVIFVGSFYKPLALIIKQARDLGIGVQFVGLDESIDVQQFFDLGGKDVNGVITTAMVIPTSTESMTFDTRYKAKFGIDPPVYTAEGYDAMTLLLKAINAGGTSGDSIKANLLKIGNNYPGVSGIITFSTNGDVQKPAVIKVAENGKFVAVQ